MYPRLPGLHPSFITCSTKKTGNEASFYSQFSLLATPEIATTTVYMYICSYAIYAFKLYKSQLDLSYGCKIIGGRPIIIALHPAIPDFLPIYIYTARKCFFFTASETCSWDS